MNFPVPSDRAAAEVTRVTPKWMLRQKLQENAEKILSLPIGPLIEIQYRMACTGTQWVWNHHLARAEEVKVPAGDLLMSVPLESADHLKLLQNLTDRLLPTIKSIDHTSLTKASATDDDDLRNLSTEALKEKMNALALSSAPAAVPAPAEDPAGADAPGAGETGDVAIRPACQWRRLPSRVGT